jgi:Uma2 family endonuclease
VQPDVFVVPASAKRHDWRDVASLLVAAEVLSPPTARADRLSKRVIYQSQQVPEYWIVDVDARVIERWRPDDDRPEILTETLTWQPRSKISPLMIELESFFAEILD